MRQKSWKGRCNSNTRSLNRPGRGRSRRRKREQALASAPACRSSATSNAMVQRRASAETRRSEEHTSELQSRLHLVCRLLLEKKKNKPSLIRLHKKKNKKKT